MNNTTYLTFMAFLSQQDTLESKSASINHIRNMEDLEFASEKQKDILLAKYGSAAYDVSVEESLQVITDIFRRCIFINDDVLDDHGKVRLDRNTGEDGKNQPIEAPQFVTATVFNLERNSIFLFHYRKLFLSATYKPSMVMRTDPMALFPVMFSCLDQYRSAGYERITRTENQKHDYMGYQRRCMEDHLTRDVTNLVFQYAWPNAPFNHGLTTELRTILLYLIHIAYNLCVFYERPHLSIPLMGKVLTKQHDLFLDIYIPNEKKEISIRCGVNRIVLINKEDAIVFCDGSRCSPSCRRVTRVLEASLCQFTSNPYVPLCALMNRQEGKDVFAPLQLKPDEEPSENLVMLLFGWGELSGYDWAYHVFMTILEKLHGAQVWFPTYAKDEEWESVMQFIDSLFGKDEKDKGRKRKSVN